MNFYFIIIISILLISCSGEEPVIKYNGVSAQSAIQLFAQATTDKEYESILNKVENNPQFGFNWNKFWLGLNRNSVFEKKINPNLISRTVYLINKNCSKNSFDSFAVAIFNYPKFHNLIFNENPTCKQNIKPETLGMYTQFYLKKVFIENKKNEFVENLPFVIKDYRNEKLNNIAEQELATLSERHIVQVLRTLSKNENYKMSVSKFIKRITLKGKNKDRYTSLLLGEIISSNELLIEYISLLSINSVSQILRSNKLTDPTLSRLTNTDWMNKVEILIKNHNDKLLRLNSKEQLIDSYLDFESLNHLISDLDKKLNLHEQLKLQESLLKPFSKKLQSIPNVESFFDYFAPTQELVWLAFSSTNSIYSKNFWQSLKGTLIENKNDFSKAVSLRNSIYLSENLNVKHQIIKQYCNFLNENNIKTLEINLNKISLESLNYIGCVEISDIGTDLKVNLSTPKDHSSSISNVLITSGASINIKANSFEYGVFDLSSNYLHNDLPIEQSPEELNSYSIPVELGIRLNNDIKDNSGASSSVSLLKGEHFFVYHYIIKEAQQGFKSQKIPLEGINGGNFNLTTNVKDQKKSISVISFGGLGQKGAPQTLGGQSYTSEYDKSNFSNAIDHYNFNNNYKNGDQSFKFYHYNLGLQLLNTLFSNAEKGHQGINVLGFSDAIHYATINSDKITKDQKYNYDIAYAYFKKQNCEDLSEVECKDQLKMNAIRQLGQLVKINKDAPLTREFDQIANSKYKTKQGSLGAINNDGEQGLPGRILIDGEQQ